MNRTRRPILIAFIGVVGAGKTHVARRLARQLKAVHIRTDDIRSALTRRGKPISRAIAIAERQSQRALRRGESVVHDFDAVNPMRQRELKALARRYGARIFFIHVKTPEKLILERLRRQRYPIPGVFSSRRHALLAHFSRRRFHRKKLRIRPLFVIDNSRPLASQIERIVRRIGAK